jgi:hypothetical protein
MYRACVYKSCILFALACICMHQSLFIRESMLTANANFAPVLGLSPAIENITLQNTTGHICETERSFDVQFSVASTLLDTQHALLYMCLLVFIFSGERHLAVISFRRGNASIPGDSIFCT